MTEQNDYPEPGAPKFPSIDDIEGQTVNVVDVVTMRDGMLAVVTSSGQTYLCDNDWASAGATFIQGKLAASNADFTRERVVREADQVGFRPVESNG